MSERRRFSRNVLVLSAVSFFNDVASESIARVLPLFLRETLKVSFAAIGWVEGVADALSILLKYASGWLSDKTRARKPLIAIGYSASALVRPFFPMVTAAFGAGGALLLKALDRVGKAVRVAPRDALIAVEAPKHGKGAAFGLNRASDTLGALVGVGLTALLLSRDGNHLSAQAFKTVVIVASLFGFAAAALVVFGISEKSQPLPQIEPDLPKPRGVLPRRYLAYLGCIALFTLAGSSDAFLLLRLRESGWSLPATLGLIAGYNAIAAIAAYPISRLSDGSLGRKKPLVIGWLIYAATYGIFGLGTSGAALGIAFVGYGLYYGCVESTEKALVSDLVPQSHLGRAYGLFSLVTGAMLLPANLIFGAIADRYGMPAAFRIEALLSVCAAIVLVCVKTSTDE